MKKIYYILDTDMKRYTTLLLHRFSTFQLQRPKFMESPTTKRSKMSDHEMNKPTQTSSNTTETREINTNYSYYDWHYNQPFYVDKTLLIKELLDTHHEYVLISAPPRFGKTLNMDMARRFLEIEIDEDGKAIELDVDENECCLKEVQTRSKNFKLFQGKKILEKKEFVFKHFGKYPTIHVNFSELVGHNFEEIFVQFKKILNKAFRQHAYLEKSSLWDRVGYNKKKFMKYFDPMKYASLDEHDVKYGLVNLAEFLHGHHGKRVYMFIDDLDVPIHTMIHQYLSINDKWRTIELLQHITGNLLREYKYIGRSLFNSTLKFSSLILQKASDISHYPFMHECMFPEFYGFEEAEVKYLLEKAGRLEDFNEIKEKYNGYNTTFCGSHIKLYNSWAIMNYLKTGNFDVYWPASILDKIKQTISHDKIRPKIAKIMSNQSCTVNYCCFPDTSDIETLSKILCRNEVDKHLDAEFFMQFLSEQGFFRSTLPYRTDLSLKIPNRTVYSVFDEVLGSIDSINKYYNHSTELIDKLTDSFEDLARLRNEEAVHALAESILALSESERTLKTKYELQSVLDAYMLQKFQHVSAKCSTSLRAKCDTILVIADLHVMFIIEYRSVWSPNDYDTHQEIPDRGYDTLAEEASLKKIFPEDTPTVKNRIYLQIMIGRFKKFIILYSFNNMKLSTVYKGEPN
ncbi:hypothetical protein PV328_001342 [Microctonus aethiopoides]|uniref:AAA-ATPase-like domain-containing protein n=1 Tax=Microctonus aethiopoides TaxID=144406 RepID=A0AA39FWR2_9HYME|nr:hypothetical protein PV328_001342 [Microctonus aethiopoides]